MIKKLEYIIILSLVAVTLGGVAIGIWNYTGQQTYQEEKTIVLEEETKTEMEVDLTGIAPGTELTYALCLEAHPGDRFEVTVCFESIGAKKLGNFVDVELFLGEESVGGGRLATLFEGEEVRFTVDFADTSSQELTLVYRMPSEVGDEAQGAVADFHMILTSKR